MIFWHVGGAIFIARTVFKDPRLDLRFLAFGAILPDLIDKPLGTLFFVDTFGTGRIFGHTILLAGLVLIGVLVFTRRGTAARRSWMMVPFGIATHLVLDIPLENKTLWWPFLGLEFPPFEYNRFTDLIDYLADSPWVIAQELLGLGYLIYLWRKSRLGNPANRRRLVKTGQLPA